MVFERYETSVTLRNEPKTGLDAYYKVIANLSAEITSKKEVLKELKKDDVRQKFIRMWHEGKTDFYL